MRKNRIVEFRAIVAILIGAAFAVVSAEAASEERLPTESQGRQWEIRRVIEISPVWSGHPVGFCLITHGHRQYVAFYDAERRMTVGARSLGSDRFELAKLPETLGWDSHNSIEMAVDDGGCIHLCGNMHCHSLNRGSPGKIRPFSL